MPSAWDTMSREETRELQSRLLRPYLRREVVPYTAFYRDLFHGAGVDVSRIRTVDDLRQLPFTSKKDLLSTPEHPKRSLDFIVRPDEADLKKRPSVIFRALTRGPKKTKEALLFEYSPMFMTSTTGRSSDPVLFLYSRHDMERLKEGGRRIVKVFGATTDDRILNMFPYAPHLAFWLVHYATTASGVFCVGTGGGKVMGTEGCLRIAAKMQPSCLIGMPTFMYHVLSQALEDKIRLENLRILILGGEKVPDGMRRKLAAMAVELGAKKDLAVMATYGFTEAKMAWGECPFRPGSTPTGYHLYPDMGIIEIIDPETGEVQPDDSPGEIVYTALDARGTIVLRYRTGDCIDGGLTYVPCPGCGRTGPRLVGKISRRSEVREMNLDKIKGTLVDFNAMEHLLDGNDKVGSWQLELRKRNDDPLEVDELILHVERLDGESLDAVGGELTQRMVEATELRPNEVQFHSAAAMRKRQGVGEEIKEKRLVDHRPKEGFESPPREKPSEKVHVYHPGKAGE